MSCIELCLRCRGLVSYDRHDRYDRYNDMETRLKQEQHLTGLLFRQQGFTRHLEKTNGLLLLQIRKTVKKSWTGCFQIGGTSAAISCYLFEKVLKIGKFFCKCGYLTLYRVKTAVLELFQLQQLFWECVVTKIWNDPKRPKPIQNEPKPLTRLHETKPAANIAFLSDDWFSIATQSASNKRTRINLYLRTVPTIVIAHTFCASPDTRISYRQCVLIQGSFCAV